MSIGTTRSQIEQELQSIAAPLTGVLALYGFGSFFRSEIFSDIDLVLVFTADCRNTLAVFENFLERLRPLSDAVGTRFDVTPLTLAEFDRKPLRESESLIPIFHRGTTYA